MVRYTDTLQDYLNQLYRYQRPPWSIFWSLSNPVRLTTFMADYANTLSLSSHLRVSNLDRRPGCSGLVTIQHLGQAASTSTWIPGYGEEKDDSRRYATFTSLNSDYVKFLLQNDISWPSSYPGGLSPSGDNSIQRGMEHRSSVILYSSLFLNTTTLVRCICSPIIPIPTRLFSSYSPEICIAECQVHRRWLIGRAWYRVVYPTAEYICLPPIPRDP